MDGQAFTYNSFRGKFRDRHQALTKSAAAKRASPAASPPSIATIRFSSKDSGCFCFQLVTICHQLATLLFNCLKGVIP